MDPCFQRRMAVLLGLLLAGVGLLRADIKLPAPAPPQGERQTTRVTRGAAATVSLRAHYGGGGTISFLIERPPEHGALSDLRVLGDNRAMVTYRNDGATSVARDSFTYVVKSSGRISSPAEVTIFVEEPPPKMRAPEQIDFGEITAGESVARNLQITNGGGGLLEGRLTVSAPWALGVANYRVSAGGSQSIELVFRPNEARNFVGQVTLLAGDGNEQTVSLLGSASSPVAIEPAEVQIKLATGKTEPRRGVVSLTNRTAQELSLKLESSPRIRPLSEVVLAPRATKKIEIEIAADRAVPVHERIAIVGPGFRLLLPIDAAAEPPPSRVEATSATISSPEPALAFPAPTAARKIAPRVDFQPAATPFSTTSAEEFVVVRAQRLNSSRWQLRWKQPHDPVAKYRIEERLLSLNGGSELQTTWRAMETSEISGSNGEVVVAIKGLDPDQLHLLRVTALAPNGTTLWESPLVALAPPREAGQGGRGWLLVLGIVLIFLVALWWRDRRG